MAVELDNKKKGLLFILGASVLGVILLFVFIAKGESDSPQDTERKVNIVADIPEPNVEELPDNKMDAYRSNKKSGRSIDAYWDSIGGEGEKPEDDLVMDTNVESETKKTKKAKRSSGVEEVSYEELFGLKKEKKAPKEDISTRRAKRDEDGYKMLEKISKDNMEVLERLVEKQNQSRKDTVADVVEEQQPVIPERDKIDIERVKIVRSGGISSIDDEFNGMSDSGFSSLDGDSREFNADESYPFKCMFVRQEKLKSSQRVSLRLLEDIVVEGQLVRKNTHLNAVCTIGDRVDLKVSSIDINGRILNLNFDAYDNDGTKGLYAPDLNDEQQLVDALRQSGISSARNRVSSQLGRVAQDLVSAGSMVISGKGKDRSVSIPAGYQFYLVKSKNR